MTPKDEKQFKLMYFLTVIILIISLVTPHLFDLYK